MHYVYIIQSISTSNYYVGETPDPESCLIFHNDKERNTNSTKSGIPWQLFWTLQLNNKTLALKIEKPIKKMKSCKYLEDLKKYPAISEKLILKYTLPGSSR